jgi:hypothetical protein
MSDEETADIYAVKKKLSGDIVKRRADRDEKLFGHVRRILEKDTFNTLQADVPGFAELEDVISLFENGKIKTSKSKLLELKLGIYLNYAEDLDPERFKDLRQATEDRDKLIEELRELEYPQLIIDIPKEKTEDQNNNPPDTGNITAEISRN